MIQEYHGPCLTGCLGKNAAGLEELDWTRATHACKYWQFFVHDSCMPCLDTLGVLRKCQAKISLGSEPVLPTELAQLVRLRSQK